MKRFIAGASIFLGALGAAHAADFVVALTGSNVPFEYADDKQNLVGFEVDLIKEAARRMGKTVEFTPIPFNAMFAAVQSGRADVAISSITVTPKRLESVAFSQPYFDSNLCLVTRKGADIQKVDGLKGKVLAVVTGSTPEIWASANEKRIGIGEVRRFDSISEPILALGSQRVDAVIQDCPFTSHYLRDKPQFAVPDQISTNEQYATMGSPKSTWLPKVNEQISAMKRDGTLAQAYKRWFPGTGEPTASVTNVLQPPAR